MGNYNSRWREVIGSTRIGQDRIETVYNFIVEFKRQFDGNGPVLREIVAMLKEVYDLEKVPDKKMGNFYIGRLVSLGKIEIEKNDLDGQRSPGRILLKQGCWICRREGATNQELEAYEDNHVEAATGAVPKQNTIKPHCNLVGEEGLL